MVEMSVDITNQVFSFGLNFRRHRNIFLALMDFHWAPNISLLGPTDIWSFEKVACKNFVSFGLNYKEME